MHHREAVRATAVVPPATVATGMRAEDEAGEEDDGDDEDDTRHDADPGSHCGEAAVALRFGRGGGRCGGGPRGGCRGGERTLCSLVTQQSHPRRWADSYD